jgi:hypothetical protein
VRKSLKKRIRFFFISVGRKLGLIPVQGPQPLVEDLRPGDRVRVKSKKEIYATLNSKSQCGQVTFDDALWAYCGTEQKVFKIVHKFMDEGKWLMRKANNCVLLENSICEGNSAIGKCDRCCFFFWRKEWLEKIGPPD